MKIKIKMFEDDPLFKPKRAHYNDAGADVRSTVDAVILPGQTVKIPLGFGLELPDGYMGVMMSRSGLASKGLVSQNAPVDSGYKGQVHAILTNTTNLAMTIDRFTRVAQLVIVPIMVADFVEEFGNERTSDGFGSTGIK
jgi:dUTP pyrophosphatase